MYLFIHLYVPPLPSSMESCKFPSCLCSFLKGKPTQWQHSPLRVKNRTKYPTSLLLAELMIPTGVSEMLKGSWDMGTSRSEQGSPFSQKGMNSFTVFSPDKAERLHFTPLCVVCAGDLAQPLGGSWRGVLGENREYTRDEYLQWRVRKCVLPFGVSASDAHLPYRLWLFLSMTFL